MRHFQTKDAVLPIHMHGLYQKASHFHQSARVQYLRMRDLDKGASLGAAVSKVISSENS